MTLHKEFLTREGNLRLEGVPWVFTTPTEASKAGYPLTLRTDWSTAWQHDDKPSPPAWALIAPKHFSITSIEVLGPHGLSPVWKFIIGEKIYAKCRGEHLFGSYIRSEERPIIPPCQDSRAIVTAAEVICGEYRLRLEGTLWREL